jgi:SAM-dependent methyltransferase
MKTPFDDLAQTYDIRIAGTGRQWTVGMTIDSLKAISRSAGHRVGGRVCDIGSGTGLYTRALEAAGCSVCAVDFSFPMLLAAKRLCEGRFVCADCRMPLPFKDDAFDAVTSFDVLAYVPDLEILFRESKRVLKKGGWFASAVPNAKSLVRSFARVARRESYAARGPAELHVFQKRRLQKQVEKTFGRCTVTVIRPVPGFASGVFTQAPSVLKPLFFWEHIGLGLLAWGIKP